MSLLRKLLKIPLQKKESEIARSSPPEMFSGKGVLKICSKFTGEHPCWSVISIKLQATLLKSYFGKGVFPVYLQHILRTLFPKNTSGGLLLNSLCLIDIDITKEYLFPFYKNEFSFKQRWKGWNVPLFDQEYWYFKSQKQSLGGVL